MLGCEQGYLGMKFGMTFCDRAGANRVVLGEHKGRFGLWLRDESATPRVLLDTDSGLRLFDKDGRVIR